tara:strand:+ start:12981 stop:13292 length:312 start_codon:yes stop_codon:yes gene_type:complete
MSATGNSGKAGRPDDDPQARRPATATGAFGCHVFHGLNFTEGDMSDNVLKASIAAQSVAERAIPVMILAMLGVFLLYGVGFAQPDVLHNAAHDGRHSFAFPCH